MNRRTVGWIAMTTLASTLTWLALVIYDTARSGPVQDMQAALAYVQNPDWVYYLNYANAALITLAATMLFAGLYYLLKPSIPLGATIAFAFVPVYSALNLFCYLSQITILPRLTPLLADPDYSRTAELLVSQMAQIWPGSLVAVVNALAYAVLAVPSLVFGLELYRTPGMLRIGGPALAISGAASLLGFLGYLLQNAVLSFGVVLGGGLFALALIPISLAFLRAS